jgi:hypothetical protein
MCSQLLALQVSQPKITITVIPDSCLGKVFGLKMGSDQGDQMFPFVKGSSVAQTFLSVF